MLSASERLAAGRLRAACRALEVDRGRRGKKTPFVIALAALVLLTMAAGNGASGRASHRVLQGPAQAGDIVGAVGDEDARHRHDGGPVRGSPQDWRRGLKPPLSLTAAPS